MFWCSLLSGFSIHLSLSCQHLVVSVHLCSFLFQVCTPKLSNHSLASPAEHFAYPTSQPCLWWDASSLLESPWLMRKGGVEDRIDSWHGALAVTWQEFRTSKRPWCLPSAHSSMQAFPVSQNCDPISSHTSLNTQPCISAAWSFRSPATQLRVLFLLGSLLPPCFCFPLSLQNAWSQLRKSPICSHLPDQTSPKSISLSHVYISLASSLFQQRRLSWISVPHDTYPLLIISNYFPGYLPEIIRSNPCMIIILS